MDMYGDGKQRWPAHMMLLEALVKGIALLFKGVVWLCKKIYSLIVLHIIKDRRYARR